MSHMTCLQASKQLVAARGLIARTPSAPPRPRPQRAMAIFGLKLPTLGKPKVAEAKAELLDAIANLQRGLSATEADRARVEAAFRRLEAANPTPNTLTSPLLNGKWELLYTTSDSILGRSRGPLRPWGPIYQTLDNTTLSGANEEGAPLFNAVSAELTPQGPRKAGVRFKTFYLLGFIPVKAPPSAVGELEVTFLDDELRLSRGNRGNIFVLKMAQPGAKPRA